MYRGIPYGQYLDTPRCRVSIDNLRMKFSYKGKAYDFERKEVVAAIDYYTHAINHLFFDHCDTAWSYCDFFKIGKYARTCTISCTDWSCAVLFGRYGVSEGYTDPDTGEVIPGSKSTFPEIVLDANPNKVPHDWLTKIIGLLRDGALSVEIVRYDVAFDFPVERDAVTLIPNDRQSYKLFREKTKGTTEYQGERSTHAAMKLYDKTKESDLPVPVTRCELTVKGDYSESLSKLLPKLTTFADKQLDTDFADLPFPVKACILHPDLIPELQKSVNRNTWGKYKIMIAANSTAELAPDNWKDIDRFIRSTLADLKGGVA